MKKEIKGLTSFTGNSNHTLLPKFEKPKVHAIVEISRYADDAEISKIIIKPAGNITFS